MQTFIYFVCCLCFVIFTTSEVYSKNVTIICPEQRIHAERLKCEIHEHCNSKYHCRVHPCYNHKICINKHKKIQQCPIKATNCPYPDSITAMQELAPVHLCTGSGDCPPVKRYSSLHEVNRCCEHECFPPATGSRICRRIERVYREWSAVQEGTSTGTRVKKFSRQPSSRSQYKKTLEDLQELKGGIGAANEGVPGAMQNAIMMNVMFMIVAALVYLWVIFKTG